MTFFSILKLKLFRWRNLCAAIPPVRVVIAKYVPGNVKLKFIFKLFVESAQGFSNIDEIAEGTSC